MIIRTAKPSDANELNRYLKKIFATSSHLITRPSEFRTGLLKKRLWIAKKQINPLEVCLVAISKKKIIGMLDNWTDQRARVAHGTCFAMSVADEWRGKGVGKELLNVFIDWVKKHPHLTRIELHVHSDNAAAIRLYEHYGFEREGLRKSAVKYEDGRIVDDIIMALLP